MRALLRILVVLATLLPAAAPADTPGAARAAGDVGALLVPNDSNYAGDQWNLKLIGMEDAWDVTTGSSSVIVAVLDTGIYSSNLDFRDASGNSRILPGKNFKDVSTPDDTSDLVGHGTFVAGIIGARGNNGFAVAGMAWNTKLLPVKVLNNSLEASDQTVADGINYAVEQGARVINLSLCATEDFPLVRGAVDNALAQGALLVAPGGNIGTKLRADQVCYPAAYPGVYAVAAVDSKSQRPSYSQQGSYIDIAAPGGTSTVPIRSTYGTGTRTDYGTSHAAPHVAGLAALMMAISPTISAETVKDIINSTATDLGPPGRDDQYGWGLINASAAVRAVLSPSLRLAPSSLQVLADPNGVYGLAPIRIEAAGRQVPYSISSDSPWLRVDGGGTASGTTPATVTVSLDLDRLPQGTTSTALLTANAPDLSGSGATATLPVTVWQSTAPFSFAYLPAVFLSLQAGW